MWEPVVPDVPCVAITGKQVVSVTVLTFFSQSIFAIQFFLIKNILKVQQLYFCLFSYIYVFKKCSIILEYMVLVVHQSAVIQICVVRQKMPYNVLYIRSIIRGMHVYRLFVCLIVFNASFNTISVIYIDGENRRTRRKPPTSRKWSHCQTLSHSVVHLALIDIRTHNISWW